jgi:F420-non-reducing hydrogenase large subunit
MSRTLVIDPVTRIEGHARVLIRLNDGGKVSSAGMIVNELRGFERILVGMQADRMPLITARICGVCPSAHHLASVKALDDAFGVEPPPAAKLLRELLYMGHYIHSHAISLFVLQGPDLVLGPDSDPAKRNVVGLVEAVPEVVRKALRLRTLGQKINELVGGRGVHPVTAVAGGITFRLTSERRDTLRKWVDEALELGLELAGVAKELFLQRWEQYRGFLEGLTLPSWYMGTVRGGKVNFYDGDLRVVDAAGNVRLEFPTRDYARYLSESALSWSYLKQVHFALEGQLHLYRVNTLARLNCADGMETPAAQGELETFRSLFGRPAHLTILYTYARVIELIYACERAKALVEDPEIMGETRASVRVREGRGVGHVEAPRGTLIHDYTIDGRGVIRAANLIVATQQNYAAINKTIQQAAQSLPDLQENEALLNRVEFAIRCYDPCLSCATHAVGRMPLEIRIEQNGRLVRRLGRNI